MSFSPFSLFPLITGYHIQIRGELLKAHWAHIDFDKGEWYIPEENSKTTAWTAPMVRALFHELKEIADDLESPWVMAGGTGRPIGDKALRRALIRLTERTDLDSEPLLDIPPCTPHDFRRTLRTHLEDLGVEPHTAEKCLNHTLGKIKRTYNRNQLLEQRRDALQKWADFVDLLVTDRVNVVRIGGAA